MIDLKKSQAQASLFAAAQAQMQAFINEHCSVGDLESDEFGFSQYDILEALGGYAEMSWKEVEILVIELEDRCKRCARNDDHEGEILSDVQLLAACEVLSAKAMEAGEAARSLAALELAKDAYGILLIKANVLKFPANIKARAKLMHSLLLFYTAFWEKAARPSAKGCGSAAAVLVILFALAHV